MNQARRLVDMLRSLQPPDKSLGQHFLVLDEVLNATVEWAEVHADDHVLELKLVALLGTLDAVGDCRVP